MLRLISVGYTCRARRNNMKRNHEKYTRNNRSEEETCPSGHKVKSYLCLSVGESVSKAQERGNGMRRQ